MLDRDSNRTNSSENQSDEEIHNVSCDGCQSRCIQDDRYRCLQCLNFDLCGECFEKRFEKDSHHSGHIYVHFKTPNELFNESIVNINKEVIKRRFASVEHTGINCDDCPTNPIVGIRFKCDTCPNYDLCLTCVEQKLTTLQHEVIHPLIIVDKNSLPQIDMHDIQLCQTLGQGGFGKIL
jgi:hypothetical protein